jgi:hypothetical protein
MNDQYFINVASASFGAEVTATTPQDMKKFLGGMAYSCPADDADPGLLIFIVAFDLQRLGGHSSATPPPGTMPPRPRPASRSARRLRGFTSVSKVRLFKASAPVSAAYPKYPKTK